MAALRGDHCLPSALMQSEANNNQKVGEKHATELAASLTRDASKTCTL